MCSPRLSSGLYEGGEKSLSTFSEIHGFFLQWGAAKERYCNNGGCGERERNSGGLLLVPDVLLIQRGDKGFVTEVCSKPLSNRLHCK